MKKIFTLLFLLYSAGALLAQRVITGTVVNRDDAQPVARATVAVKGTTQATLTDAKGQFSLTVQSLPVKLQITSASFTGNEVTVSSDAPLEVFLNKRDNRLEEITVTGAERGKKRYLLEVPVSVEVFGPKDFRAAAATGYYDLLANAKGVDVTTSSFTFKTVSTRGFNTSGSARVNQIVDGMDNQAPGLNFYVGNFVGLTELDVESIEVLPGASSALYGPGGMNGTILMNSKNPFKYQGLSLLLKEGISNVDKTQRDKATPFHDFALRYAKAFGRFAFKAGVQYLKATDWLAGDESNYTRQGDRGHVIPGNRNSDPNYDGVNVYGDETSVNIGSAANPFYVSRTGYHERDVIDPATKNLKLSGAVHYRLPDSTELQFMGYWGTGNTVYTGNNRYALKGIKIGQYKLEARNRNWFLRAYTTQEDAGEAYSATAVMQVFNELWKPSQVWYPQFGAAYMQARGGGADHQTAVVAARAEADKGRPLPGSTEFAQLFDKARSVPIPNGGRFLEQSQLWMGEGQYNFSHLLPFVDIVVGANLKQYVLNSKGTIFIDSAAPIRNNEWGAYAQLTKKLNPAVTLSFSGRYDKNEDFDGKFTPRATALVRIARDNNLRFSYQTAYRFATTTQKYILLNVGAYTLIGGLPWIKGYLPQPVIDLATQKPFAFQPLKPESMQSFEAGYKGLIAQRLLIDAYAYFGKYRDFYGRNVLYAPSVNKVYSSVVNSTNEVKTHGYGLGFDYRLPRNFFLTLNGYYDVLTDVPENFQPQFNTPKYRANLGVGNTGLGRQKAVGFNVVARWQDAFYSEGDLASGEVDAFTVVDAQVNYQLPKQKVMIKVGGTNVFNHYYKNAYGNPEIGGLYYLSLGFGF